MMPSRSTRRRAIGVWKDIGRGGSQAIRGDRNEVQTLRIISRTFCEFVISKLLLPSRWKRRMRWDKELHVSHVLLFHVLDFFLSLSLLFPPRPPCGWNKLSLIGSFCKVLPSLSALSDLIRCRKKTLAGKGKQECWRRCPVYGIGNFSIYISDERWELSTHTYN